MRRYLYAAIGCWLLAISCLAVVDAEAAVIALAMTFIVLAGVCVQQLGAKDWLGPEDVQDRNDRYDAAAAEYVATERARLELISRTGSRR